MSKRSWLSHYFSLTASSADGKDTASVRHYLYKYNDGATTVWATRVDDVIDMLCPNQKTRDVLTKKLDQRRGRILFDAFVAHCVRLGENVNDFVERLLDEGALTECSGTGERCVHLETASAAPHSCSGRAPPDVSVVQAMLSCLTRSIACCGGDRR